MEVEEVVVPAGFVAGALGTAKKKNGNCLIPYYYLAHLHNCI